MNQQQIEMYRQAMVESYLKHFFDTLVVTMFTHIFPKEIGIEVIERIYEMTLNGFKTGSPELKMIQQNDLKIYLDILKDIEYTIGYIKQDVMKFYGEEVEQVQEQQKEEVKSNVIELVK